MVMAPTGTDMFYGLCTGTTFKLYTIVLTAATMSLLLSSAPLHSHVAHPGWAIPQGALLTPVNTLREETTEPFTYHHLATDLGEMQLSRSTYSLALKPTAQELLSLSQAGRQHMQCAIAEHALQ